MRGGTYVLNFYSAVFVDQLKRGRKTATIRLGDKSNKYERGQVVRVTVEEFAFRSMHGEIA
jgi:hypothetical protein